MRVGYISTYPPTECGIATYTQYLTEALRKKATDVYIVCHIGGSGQQVFPAFDYEDGDLAEKAYSTMVRFTPDVVHVQHEYGLFGKYHGVSVVPLLIQFRMLGIPVVTTLHTVYQDTDPAHTILMESIVLNSDRVIIHEEYQRKALEQTLPAGLRSKIVVIPHGAREVEILPDARKDLGLPEDKKIILIIGYIRPSKNFELVIDIFPKVLERFPEALLVMAGKIRGQEYVDYRNFLFQKIAQSPARENIIIIRGQLPQDVFDKLLCASDVVVLPYKISSQSGILAHCLSFGRPIVASNSQALLDAMAKTKAGLVCDGEVDFVDNIVRILSNPDFANTLSENGRRYVREHISWSIVADKHLALYREITYIPNVQAKIITTA